MDECEVEARLDRARDDRDALGPVLESYKGRIERMIRMRMDPRVVTRTGVSDVLQDAYVEVSRRLPDYLDERAEGASGSSAAGAPSSADGESSGPMPFFIWVRFIAAQAVARVHRVHLGTLARDAGRDVPIAGGPHASGGGSSMLLASALLEHGVSPSGAAAMQEQREILAESLSELSETDREILLLRHFEQLSAGEVADVLGLTRSGARVRYLNALRRLRAVLGRAGMSFGPLGAPEGRPDEGSAE